MAESKTQKMVGDLVEAAMREILARPTTKGKARRDLEARLADMLAYRAKS